MASGEPLLLLQEGSGLQPGGQEEVEDHPHQGGQGHAAHLEGHRRPGHLDRPQVGHGPAQAQDEDGRDHDEVAALGEVNLRFRQGADADGGDHPEEEHGDPPQHPLGQGLEKGGELGDEGEKDGEARGDAEDQGVVHPGHRQDPGVFGVGGVGGAA